MQASYENIERLEQIHRPDEALLSRDPDHCPRLVRDPRACRSADPQAVPFLHGDTVSLPLMRTTTESQQGPGNTATHAVLVGTPARLLCASVVVLAVALLGALGVLAFQHANDRYQVDEVAGTRMALAMWADEGGRLYPPLYDGEHYGGSRSMPIPIVLHAGLAKLTGEYLTSGKVLSAVSFLLLLTIFYLVLRSFRVPLFLTVALVGTVVATQIGFEQAAGIKADALPAALQLAAIFVVSRSKRTVVTVSAGVLCSLALFAKFSAVWAPLAIVVWGLIRERRVLWGFIASYLGACALLLAIFYRATEGRLVENFVAFSFAGVSGETSILRPGRMLPLLATFGLIVWGLLPFAILELAGQVRARDLQLPLLALVACTIVTAVAFTAVGVNYNHLTDLIVLIAVGVGAYWARTSSTSSSLTSTAAALMLLLVMGLVTAGLSATVGPGPGKGSGGASGNSGTSTDVISRYVKPGDSVLYEDPGLAVSHGALPIVLDPFMLLRLDQQHPEWIDDLIDRIRLKDFDRIVLEFPIEAPTPRDRYDVNSLGRRVVDAIDRYYEPISLDENGVLLPTDRYVIYAPR